MAAFKSSFVSFRKYFRLSLVVIILADFALFTVRIDALDNGLALTPPMGWMAWERFRCNIDCKNDPDNCISEKLFMQMADRIAEDGFKNAGYQYVCIDMFRWSITDKKSELLEQAIDASESATFTLQHGGFVPREWLAAKGLLHRESNIFKRATCNKQIQGFQEIEMIKKDCWSSHNRTLTGDLQPDHDRFPRGIKYLADYIHSKGLKFGLYADYGTQTCERYPGSIQYIQQDMQLFADWGVDYLKLDGCFADPLTFDEGYPTVTRALNESGRHIVFSCSWPAYLVWGGIKPNYPLIAKHCNLWRNYNDIQDSWYSLIRIIDWYGDHQDEMIPVAGPGHWNDPDQLLIGDFSLSYEQSKTQFAIWAIVAAPLMMSNDLRNIAPWARDILLNKEIIEVNQDKLGKMGRRVSQSFRQYTEVWSRPLSDGSVAVVLFSRRHDQPYVIEAFFDEVGLSTSLAKARDLFEHKNLGTFKKSFKAKVNPSGVVMVKLSPIQDEL